MLLNIFVQYLISYASKRFHVIIKQHVTCFGGYYIKPLHICITRKTNRAVFSLNTCSAHVTFCF